MIEFGQKLRKKREKKGISLEEISVNTNISITYLRAIESGDMSQLPESFMKLFMKSYANEIGVNLYLDKNPSRATIIKHQSNLFDSIDDVYPGQEMEYKRSKKKGKKYKNIFKLGSDVKDDKILEDSELKSKSTHSDSSIFSESFDENDMSNLSIFMDNDHEEPTIQDFLKNNRIGVVITLAIILITIVSFSAYYFLHEEEITPNEIPMINVITVSGSEGGISVNMRDSVYFDEEPNSEESEKFFSDSISLKLVSLDTCYVIHYNDDNTIVENIMLPGNKLLIKGGNLIEMKLGKIEALSFEFNGKKVKEEIFKRKKGTAYLKVSRLFGVELVSKSSKIVNYLKNRYGLK